MGHPIDCTPTAASSVAPITGVTDGPLDGLDRESPDAGSAMCWPDWDRVAQWAIGCHKSSMGHWMGRFQMSHPMFAPAAVDG